MKYCVIKGSLKVIDGGANSTDVMMQNALNSGFGASEVEILTEEEYNLRVESEPKPPKPPTELDILKEENEALKVKLQATEQIVAETSETQQELLELLIDMGVI